MVDHLIEKVNIEAKKLFNIDSTKDDVIILDSSYSGKYSNHVVFNKIIFREADKF